MIYRTYDILLCGQSLREWMEVLRRSFRRGWRKATKLTLTFFNVSAPVVPRFQIARRSFIKVPLFADCSWAVTREKAGKGWRFDRKQSKKDTGNHIRRTEGKRCSAKFEASSWITGFCHHPHSRRSYTTGIPGSFYANGTACLLCFGDLPETYELRKKFNCSRLRITALSGCNPITGFLRFN